MQEIRKCPSPTCARLQGVEWETALQRELGSRAARVVGETPFGIGDGRGVGCSVALLTNDSNLERCQRYANLLPEM